MEPVHIHSLEQQLDALAGSVVHILPELVLTGSFLLMLIAELAAGKRFKLLVPVLGLLGLAATGALVALQGQWGGGLPAENGPAAPGTFLGMVQPDGFGRSFHLLFDFAAFLTILVSIRSSQLRNQARGTGEYMVILAAMVIGMHFMSMATNLLMMYLALEMVSLPSYLLTAYTRLNGKSAEAALKYVIYGSFSSGIMLYGISWLYGLTGTLDPLDPAFATGIAAAEGWPLLFILLLVLGGFMFKISALPFHFWAPDVYEGAPYPVAAFFSVAPKAAGFAMLIRFLWIFPMNEALQAQLTWALALIAIGSMFLGNFAALRQESFRRMLAYSSIAQAGYMLVGVLCFTQLGVAATMFYLVVYFCMNFSAFLMAGWLGERMGIEKIDDLKGLASGMPLLAVLAALFMVSLTGLPPTAGFIGKAELFLAGLERFQNDGHPAVMAAMVSMLLNTVVSLFYYLRIPARMIFQNALHKSPLRFHGWAPYIALVLALPTLWLGILTFDELINWFMDLALNLNG